MVRADQRIQIPDHKFLASRKIVAQQILDYSVHHLGTNDVSDQCHQQQQEREEGQNEVGGDREGKGVHIGPKQIARGGAQNAFGWSGTMLGCAFLVGKLDGSDRRHWFLNIIKYLRVAVEALRARVTRAWRWIGSGSNSLPCGCRQTVNNFVLANRNLPAIICCFVNRIRLAMSSRIDVSVPG